MRHSARCGDLLQVEAVAEVLGLFPQPQPGHVLDRCDRHVQLVDEICVQELAHGGDAPSDPHIETAGGRFRLLERLRRGRIEEVERGLTLDL